MTTMNKSYRTAQSEAEDFIQGFKDTLASWPSGVAVVTAVSDGLAHGTTIASFSSLSLDPPMVLACLSSRSRLVEIIAASGSFTISLLSESQAHLSKLFANPERMPSPDLHGLAAEAQAGSAPAVDGAIAILDCRLEALLPAGDHVIVTARVLSAAHDQASTPLLYFRRSYHALAELSAVDAYEGATS